MTRQYDSQLIKDMNARQFYDKIFGVDVLVKPIPETDLKGAMDNRLWEANRMSSLFSKFIPKNLLDVDLTDINVVNKLRVPFNNVDSTPIVNKVIHKTTYTFKSFDDEPINMHLFKSETAEKNAPVLYYIHGGGFFAGRTEVVEEALKLWIEKFDIIVYSIDYRLAPEYPYPTGHKDTYQGLQWIHKHTQEHGGNPNLIFVGGDSAGGNLAQYCSTRDRENGNSMIKGQYLLYPTLNMAELKDEFTSFTLDKFDINPKQARAIVPGLEGFEMMISKLGNVLQTDDIDHQYLSPYGHASADNPPTFITVGEHDYLRLESIAYARRLTDLGVDVTTVMYKGLGHAYIDHIGNYPQAEDCVHQMGLWMNKVIEEKELV